MFIKREEKNMNKSEKNVESFLIENLLTVYIDKETKNILLSMGYNNINDIIKDTKKEFANKIYKELKNKNIDPYTELKQLSRLLHCEYNVCFNEEYEDLGLSKEETLTKIEDLNLNYAIVKALNYSGAYTLGDLLSIEPQEFSRMRNFGDRKLKYLTDKMHMLGYSLKNEKTRRTEVKKSELIRVLEYLKNYGVEKLDEKFLNNPFNMYVLNVNGIYNVRDLINYESDVNNIFGISNAKQNEILTMMKELGLKCDSNCSKVDLSNIKGTNEMLVEPNDAHINQIKEDNDVLKKRILQKKQLLEEYNELMKEKEKLLARESELDEMILSLSSNVKVKKKNVRK